MIICVILDDIFLTFAFFLRLLRDILQLGDCTSKKRVGKNSKIFPNINYALENFTSTQYNYCSFTEINFLVISLSEENKQRVFIKL